MQTLMSLSPFGWQFFILGFVVMLLAYGLKWWLASHRPEAAAKWGRVLSSPSPGALFMQLGLTFILIGMSERLIQRSGVTFASPVLDATVVVILPFLLAFAIIWGFEKLAEKLILDTP